MTFLLEKYKIDRTFLGNQRLQQGGRWQMLYRPFLPALLFGALAAVGGMMQAGGNGAGGGVFLLIGAIGLLPAAVHYGVQSTRLLANHRTAGPLGLVAAPRTSRVLGIYAGGYALILAALGALIFAGLIAVGTVFGIAAATLPNLEDLPDVPAWIPALLGIAAYFSVFLLWGVLGHVFVTLPLWRHYAETLTITGTENLSAIRQRPRDEFSDAEGFAEALDLGAAI
jgi:hypothetical protein